MDSEEPATAPSMAATLRDPMTYGRSPWHVEPLPPGPVPLCETHVSWIALAGPLAYKLKKPVRFDFLDYGSLDKRHAACLVELELNRRWAPDLYLGLSRLVQTPAGRCFDTDGSLIEYAVRMLRFERGAELDSLLRHGEIDRDALRQFGAAIAELHERAPLAQGELGRPAALWRATSQNLETLRAALPGNAIAALADWATAAWPGVEAALGARRAAGRVRECHGDLHCGNVVRHDNRLVPFDGIDFDPELRFIDVLSDIAFLVMDLEAHDRSDLAMTCLSAYLEITGDYPGTDCLRFLLVYRALVRAKIAALRAHQLAGSAAETSTREAVRYLGHAHRFATRPAGSLVLLHGYSGSGKSTVAAALVPELRAIQIRADILRRGLDPRTARLPHAGGIDEGRYAPGHTDRTYERLAESVGGLLRAGIHVLADATFLEPRRREPFIALARRLGSPVAILSCEAPPDVLRRRIVERTEDASEATLAVLERQLDSGPRLEPSAAVPVVTVHTDVVPDAAVISNALERALQPAVAMA